MALVEHQVKVDDAAAGRIDQIVVKLTGRSRADVRGLFHHECVRWNGRLCKSPGAVVSAGDEVAVLHDPHRRYEKPTPERGSSAFTLIYEDEHLLVVDKAAAVLSVPTDTGGERTLVDAVSDYLKRKQGKRTKAAPVHRLDKGTSGLLVFGKSDRIAKELQEQFRVRKAERVYHALVAGAVARDSGTIQSRLGTTQRLQRYSVRSGEQGELAITHFEVASRLRGATHLQVSLETGRRNQIRVHFAEQGHPVLGDQRYRPDLSRHPGWKARRLALHAAVLGFDHPVDQRPLRFEAPLPKEFERFLEAQRLPGRSR